MTRPSKEELHRLYWEAEMSADQLATKFGVAPRTIYRWMSLYGIPRRTLRQAGLVRKVREATVPAETSADIISSLDDVISTLSTKVPITQYEYTPRDNIWLSLPLKWFAKKREKEDVALTLCMSDIHLGDCNHLSRTYWSAINTLVNVLEVIKRTFNVRRLTMICNGDVVAGREVYRYQIFRNLLQRGHWQVFLAEAVLKKTLEIISELVPVKTIYFTKGHHESLAENYILYLTKTLPKAKYLGHFGILNIGKPIGNYNILVTHGKGRSDYYPVSYSAVRELWKSVNQYKMKGMQIERCLVGHSHWLTTNLELEGVLIDETGGFQQWEYTIHQRPCGMILYIFYEGEVSAVPIRPDKNIEIEEKSSADLEYSNMLYYAEMLKDHFEAGRRTRVT